jgi:ZIP family zinc transporter
VGGIFGGGLLLLASTLLPFALSFAGGAMLFVVSDEIIPESHRTGHEKHATFGVVIGFIIMMLLDNLF